MTARKSAPAPGAGAVLHLAILLQSTLAAKKGCGRIHFMQLLAYKIEKKKKKVYVSEFSLLLLCIKKI